MDECMVAGVSKGSGLRNSASAYADVIRWAETLTGTHHQLFIRSFSGIHPELIRLLTGLIGNLQSST
jgi:hypothetical protein